MSILKNLRGQFDAVLTRDKLKNVVGGVGEWQEPGDGECRIALRNADGEGKDYCKGKSEGDSCQHPNGGTGRCEYFPMSGGKLVCNKRNGW